MSFNPRSRFMAVLLAFDELGNAILGPSPYAPCAGNPHYTISQRLAELRNDGRRVGCLGCKLLTIIFKPFNRSVPNYDHCTEALEGFPDSLPTDG